MAKTFTIRLSVESVGTVEVEADSEEEAMKRIKEVVQAGKLDLDVFHPLFYRGAIDKDIMEYEDLGLQ